ncbi:unnamed protein product [Clonostachys rosea]|uniref:Major facilitator superfamily (MFS) profile domain-containing protein n=1 Tax=Bionectria ochroleuca TaxID=29856 RepID=A0ABY6ULC7_BIOOC|nr:unnamed protein product [Clonostachys rosea]
MAASSRSSTSSERESSKRDSMHTAGSVFFVSSDGRVLKLPIPSKSSRDPLTWSRSKRAFAFCALQLYSVVASFEVNLPGLLMRAVQNEFEKDGIDRAAFQALSSAMTLFTGFGYLLSIPLSTAVGRRPVFVGATVVTSASTLWAGCAPNFGNLMTALCFQGLACGAAIGMCLLILIDATFIHERPNALSLYWCVGSVFIKLSILILPFIADLNTCWRTVYQVWLAPCLVAAVAVIFFVPETYFFRPPVSLDGRILLQTSSEKVEVYQDWGRPYTPTERPLPALPAYTRFWSRLKVSRAPGTTWSAAVTAYMQMLLCILNPLTFWVSLLTGIILSGVIFLNLSQPSVLAQGAKDPEAVSMWLGVAGIIGSMLAFPFTGPLATWFARYYSLRNGGVRHAEVYLPAFAIPVLTGLASVLISGFAIEKQWNAGWLYMTSAISILSYLTGNVAFTIWITEAFPRWAAAALAVQLFTGNMVSFGIASAILPWTTNHQIMQPTLLISVLIGVLGILAVPIAFWGKNVRQYIHGWSSDSEKTALRPQ